MLFLKRLKSESVPSFPALVVALVYLGFGTWALIVSKLNPFFFIFIVLGVLLAVAALPVPRRGARQKVRGGPAQRSLHPSTAAGDA